jgi:chromosome segregation ATPase
MSNEELERIMNFIIERQEYTAAQLAKITEAHDRSAERLDDHDERITRFERSYVAISRLLERHDDQLVAVTEGLHKVTDRLAVVSHG